MELIIFDMGGVVCENTAVFPYILDFLQIDKKKFYEIVDNNVQRLQIGEISSQNFWGEFSNKSEKDVNEDLWKKFFQPERNDRTMEIITNLKKKFRVIAGTNTIDSHFEVHNSRKDYDIFDKVYASHIIGFAKPDPDFYKWILKNENCEPEKSVFIDDNLDNIAVAKELGINAIHFKDAENLRNDLEQLNLL
ncbi:MAG: HAD family phosphatase [Halanaerobiales bacterium]|nr:HAD family phosphatase [Halanaerobiales bacterium]